MEAIEVYRNIQALSAEFATERRERQRRRELVRQCYTCRYVKCNIAGHRAWEELAEVAGRADAD